MKRTHACFLVILLGISAPFMPARALAPAKLIEASVEAVAEDLSLPMEESGIITVRACSSCSTQTFYFAREHVLILSGRPVSLKEMSAALRRNGKAAVTVHFRRDDQQVTRIVLAMMPSAGSSSQ